MYKFSLFLTILALSVSLLAGCGDPADGTIPPTASSPAATVPATTPVRTPGTEPTGHTVPASLPNSLIRE